MSVDLTLDAAEAREPLTIFSIDLQVLKTPTVAADVGQRIERERRRGGDEGAGEDEGWLF